MTICKTVDLLAIKLSPKEVSTDGIDIVSKYEWHENEQCLASEKIIITKKCLIQEVAPLEIEVLNLHKVEVIHIYMSPLLCG